MFNWKDVSEMVKTASGVYCGKWHERSVLIVVSTSDQPYDKHRFITDMKALASAPHPNVLHPLAICFHDAKDSKDDKPLLFPQLGVLYENCKDMVTLESVLKSDTGISLDQRASLCLQIAAAISHCHSIAWVHCNLSTANIRIDQRTWQPKLFDSDLTYRFASTTISNATARYAAPERFEPEFACTANSAVANSAEAADVYGLGGILYGVFTGQEPWLCESITDIREKVVGGQRPPFISFVYRPDLNPFHNPSYCVPSDLMGLITECWKHKPEDRPRLKSLIGSLQAIFDEKNQTGFRSFSGWKFGRRSTLPTLPIQSAAPVLFFFLLNILTTILKIVGCRTVSAYIHTNSASTSAYIRTAHAI
jgi:serine/threonine protein kinase